MEPATSRIVVKFGTGILTRLEGNTLDIPQFRRLTGEIGEAIRAGHQCILVSSGAVGAGMMVLGYQQRPTELPAIQACAAVGQTRLMRLYQSLFARHRLHVAQLLLTHQDMDSRTRRANARNTLETLLSRGDTLPIINENDSVAVEELKFSDNDQLSADVAILAQADQLIICTSANGLTRSGDPNDDPIAEVTDLEAARALAQASHGPLSVGGMTTKLTAVGTALAQGITTRIINGRDAGSLSKALRNDPVGTKFYPAETTSAMQTASQPSFYDN